MNNLIVENVTKEYRMFKGKGERFLCAASLGILQGSMIHNAISAMNLVLAPGKIYGIVGPNGAGKSTLLRMISGISPPTSGRIQYTGTVRSLLELGVGFSAELTVSENIFYNGLLWGYSQTALRLNQAKVLEFAGLEDYADQPLKSLSTGMQMRLGFALATMERSDILIVDEALAVGDASFQQKCLDRFSKFKMEGSLILVVSHDLNMLVSICDEMLFIAEGRIQNEGSPPEVAESYIQYIGKLGSDNALDKEAALMSIRNDLGIVSETFRPGENARLDIYIDSETNLENITIGIHISNSRGVRVFGTNSYLMKKEICLSAGRTLISFEVVMNLGPGKYSAGFSVHRGKTHASDCYVWKEHAFDFIIDPAGLENFEGTSFMDARIVSVEPVGSQSLDTKE